MQAMLHVSAQPLPTQPVPAPVAAASTLTLIVLFLVSVSTLCPLLQDWVYWELGSLELTLELNPVMKPPAEEVSGTMWQHNLPALLRFIELVGTPCWQAPAAPEMPLAQKSLERGTHHLAGLMSAVNPRSAHQAGGKHATVSCQSQLRVGLFRAVPAWLSGPAGATSTTTQQVCGPWTVV